MSLTPRSPIQAALGRGQTFCENSIREGTIFIPRRDSYLVYSIAIDLVLNGGHRLGRLMSEKTYFLEGKRVGQLVGFCV